MGDEEMNKQNISKRVLQFGAIIQLFALSSVLTAQPDTTLHAFSHFGGWPDGAAIKGDYAYLVQGMSLNVLDISGAKFERIGALTLSHEPTGIALQGNHAYLFAPNSNAALQVIDIADPAAPKFIAEAVVATGWPVKGTVAGDAAYIVSNDSLKILDISDPAAPIQIGVAAVPGIDVFIQGSLAYVGCDDGLRILDVANPAAPKVLSFFPTANINGVSVAQGTAFLLGYRSFNQSLELVTVNVADSTQPELIGSTTTAINDYLATDQAGCICMQGNVVYLTAKNNLLLFDVSTPATPALLSQLKYTEGAYPEFQSLQVIHPFAYAAMGTSDYGFVKINVESPANPTIASVLIEPWDVTHFVARGETLFVASQERLLVYDYADPRHPQLLGENDAWQQLYRIFVAKDRLYGLDTRQLHIVDVSNPGAMEEIGSFSIPNDEKPRAVMVRDSVASLLTVDQTDTRSHLRTLDVSDPTAIQQKATFDFDGEGRDLFVGKDGAVAFVAYADGETGGMRLISINDPAAPVQLDSRSCQGKPSCIWANDSLAFVGSNKSDSTWVIEVFTRTTGSPSAAQVGGPGKIADLEVSGNRIYAAVQGGCVHEFCYVCFYETVMAWLISVCPSPVAICIALIHFENEFYAFTSDGYWDEESLMASASLGIFLQLKYLFGTPVEKDSDPPAPLQFALQQNYPNPFNPSTLIRYTLPQNNKVRLEVYNALGQRMAVLLDQEQKAGQHEITFHGENLPSGLYFYRLQAGEMVQERKMLLVH
jgi:hypothetical protein